MGNEDFDGIFVGGQPLDAKLIDDERDAKSHEIERLRKAAEKKTRSAVVYGNERRQVDTRRVARRVKHLTERQIRKEYGIMAKPFETIFENIIWAIIEKGPLTTLEIGVELEWTQTNSSLSAAVSTVWRALGDQHPESAAILQRKKIGLAFSYFKKPGLDISVEAAADRYKIFQKKINQSGWAAKQAAKKAAKVKRAVTVSKRAVAPAEKSTALEWREPVSKPANEVVATVAGKTFNVEVMVSGQVEIIFKLG